jgi:hypothetical protein
VTSFFFCLTKGCRFQTLSESKGWIVFKPVAAHDTPRAQMVAQIVKKGQLVSVGLNPCRSPPQQCVRKLVALEVAGVRESLAALLADNRLLVIVRPFVDFSCENLVAGAGKLFSSSPLPCTSE